MVLPFWSSLYFPAEPVFSEVYLRPTKVEDTIIQAGSRKTIEAWKGMGKNWRRRKRMEKRRRRKMSHSDALFCMIDTTSGASILSIFSGSKSQHFSESAEFTWMHDSTYSKASMINEAKKASIPKYVFSNRVLRTHVPLLDCNVIVLRPISNADATPTTPFTIQMLSMSSRSKRSTFRILLKAAMLLDL